MVWPTIKPKSEKAKRDWKWPVIVALAVIVMIITLVPLGWDLYCKQQYRHFLSEVSSNTVIAYKKNMMEVKVNGETAEVDSDFAYGIYDLICVAGYGKTRLNVPEREADVSVKYQFGYLEIWYIEINDETAIRDHGVQFAYTDFSGKRYSFDTDTISKDSIERKLAESGYIKEN